MSSNIHSASHKEILERAITKAIDGGWKMVGWTSAAQLLTWRWEEDYRLFSEGVGDDYESINLEGVIFNHDFAKALWGEGQEGVEMDYINGWQYHLQQMVIADDPIEYLGDNI